MGREIATIDQKGQTTHFIYDDLDRLVETIYPDNTPLDLSDNPRNKTEYDKIGRVKASVDERGNRTQYEYDKAGRPILIHDALNNETKYTYDAAGNRLTETDARNQTTKFVCDALGRPAETHFADGTRTITTYDAVGRRSFFYRQPRVRRFLQIRSRLRGKLLPTCWACTKAPKSSPTQTPHS
jgi:large repetitive protein